MVKVYRIWVYPEENNKYGINRNENWVLRDDKTFEDINDAKEYIIKQSLIHIPEMANFALQIPQDKKMEFYHRFCFDNDMYWRYRLFLLEKNDYKKSIERIKE